MGYVRFPDLLAGLVAVALLLGILILTALGRPIPDLIANVFAAAMGWVFRGGGQVLNEMHHARRIDNDA